jgi:predicted  nucleic acid-binding Zn-ribbon protein
MANEPVVKCFENCTERNELKANIERLQERCEAYKGQVKAGSAEIERLKAVIARWEQNFAPTSPFCNGEFRW